ncbi:MAG: hypothetical protein ACYTHK_03945 [Planctomycetota bacterium]
MDQNHKGGSPTSKLGSLKGDGAVICSFFRHIMAFGRVMRIYASGNTRVEESLAELKAIADEMLGGRTDEMDIIVHTNGLKVDGRTVHHEPAVTEAFTDVLRARGVRALVLRFGIDRGELVLLADLLGRPGRDLITDGGMDAVLAGKEHPHFDLLAAVTAFGDGEDDGCEDDDIPPEEAATRQFEELLGESGELPPDPTEQHRLVYTARDKDELATGSSNLLAVAEETLRAEAARHDSDRAASMAVCDMVGRAGDELEYRRRRDVLCDVVREKRLDPRAMRIAQLHLAGDLPDWPHEDPAALLLELGAIAADSQLLEGSLSRSTLSKAQARQVAENLASRPEAFDLFCVLVRSPMPDNIRIPVEDVFVDTVRHRKMAFKKWALENPQRFLCKSAFELLMARVDFVLGPIVKEYLAVIGSKERDRLIELLVDEGTEKALRLLVMGVRYAGEVRDPRIILAFGRFKHALAVGVLREVVLRCNTERYDAEEASSAIRALAETGIDDAYDFLEEITSGRKFLMPIYRRSLREMAQDALEVA